MQTIADDIPEKQRRRTGRPQKEIRHIQVDNPTLHLCILVELPDPGATIVEPLPPKNWGT